MIAKLKESKNIQHFLTAVVVIVVVLLLYMIFIYAPRRRKLIETSNLLSSIDLQLEDVQKAIGQRVSFEEGAVALKSSFDELSRKFLDKEQTSVVLNELSDLANTWDLRIISIEPRKFREVEGVVLDAHPCLCLPIQLTLQGGFEDFGEYLKALTSSKNSIFTIEEFDIRKDQNVKPDLAIKLLVNAYVFDINK